MNIPKFWAKATVQGTDNLGAPVACSCWRSSDSSPEEAHVNALASAKNGVERMGREDPPGHYWYARGPIREEVIERFTDADGESFAAVTRNRFGVLMLNSARVMFIDWDKPEPVFTTWLSAIRELFFPRRRMSAGDYETTVRERIAKFRETNRDWSLRLYRTAAGLRGLVTHALFDPAADSTMTALKFLESDPLYIRLCQAQSSFRARLTPKPWRCGVESKGAPWPREGSAKDRFEKWLGKYETHQREFATCQFVCAIGSEVIHPEVQPIIKLHDKLTRSHEPLPLA